MVVQGWGEDYLHQFHTYGKDYGISHDDGTGFPDSPLTERDWERATTPLTQRVFHILITHCRHSHTHQPPPFHG